MSEERVLIPAAELARRLSLSKFTIYKMIAADRIPYVRLGKKSVRLDPDQVVKALEREGASRGR